MYILQPLKVLITHAFLQDKPFKFMAAATVHHPMFIVPGRSQ